MSYQDSPHSKSPMKVHFLSICEKRGFNTCKTLPAHSFGHMTWKSEVGLHMGVYFIGYIQIMWQRYVKWWHSQSFCILKQLPNMLTTPVRSWEINSVSFQSWSLAWPILYSMIQWYTSKIKKKNLTLNEANTACELLQRTIMKCEQQRRREERGW